MRPSFVIHHKHLSNSLSPLNSTPPSLFRATEPTPPTTNGTQPHPSSKASIPPGCLLIGKDLEGREVDGAGVRVKVHQLHHRRGL